MVDDDHIDEWGLSWVFRIRVYVDTQGNGVVGDLFDGFGLEITVDGTREVGVTARKAMAVMAIAIWHVAVRAAALLWLAHHSLGIGSAPARFSPGPVLVESG
jgi:hypothetical protein